MAGFSDHETARAAKAENLPGRDLRPFCLSLAVEGRAFFAGPRLLKLEFDHAKSRVFVELPLR